MADERPFREHLVDVEDRLIARISAVETQNRALRRLTTALSVLVGLGLVVGVIHFMAPTALEFVRPNVGVIEANGFVVRDRDGAVRGQLVVEDDGRVRFSLHDLTETRRVSVSVLSGGSPGLALTDREGQNRLAMGVANDGSSTLVFADRAGNPRAVLGLSSDESAGLSIVDGGGVRRVELGVDSNGMATVLVPGGVERDTDEDEVGRDDDE
jgi:hypothetical protein